MKGSYILLIRLSEAETISPGSLAEVHFPGGYYAYVGSALSGLESRLNRHLRRDKKRHWHIDYLLPKASITDIIIGETGDRRPETGDRVECAIARALGSQFDAIPGFGSSDCRCPSHLFFAPKQKPMKASIMVALASLGIPPKLMGLKGQ